MFCVYEREAHFAVFLRMNFPLLSFLDFRKETSASPTGMQNGRLFDFVLLIFGFLLIFSVCFFATLRLLQLLWTDD